MNLNPTTKLKTTARRVTVVDRPGQDKAHFTNLKPKKIRQKAKNELKKLVIFNLKF